METDRRPTIYLHVGYNKAGSTALQHWFSGRQTKLLEQHALLYPRCGLDGAAHYGLSEICGFSPAGGLPDDADLERFSELLRLEINRSGCTRVLISSEDFVLNQDPTLVRNLLREYPVRIVMFLRRHDHWWESAYKQAVRMIRRPKWEPGIEGFIAFNQDRNPWYASYRDFVDRWSQAFSREQILVRPYELSQMQGGIVPDMLSVLSLSTALADDAAGQRMNPSLDNRATALLDWAQRCDLTHGELQKLLDYLQVHHSKPEEPALLSPWRRRQLIEDNLEDYGYIARTFLGRKDGELFKDPFPEAREPWERPAALKSTEIIQMLVGALRA